MKCAILLAISCTAAMMAADLPKAETLLDKYVEVTGGKANYEKRSTEYMSGTVEIPAAGVKGKVEMWAQAPNSRVEVIEIEGVGRMETGTDGTNAWENSAIMGPRLRSGPELRYHLREAMFNAPIRWREVYKKAETTGVEKVEGADAYRVVMTPIEGKPETWFIDQKTNYIVKMARTSVTTMGEVNGEYLMKDYKDMNGIIMPMTLIQKAAGSEIRVKFETVIPNGTLPKERFAPPAEIKQLMAAPAKKAA
jgi:hypothetical protein